MHPFLFAALLLGLFISAMTDSPFMMIVFGVGLFWGLRNEMSDLQRRIDKLEGAARGNVVSELGKATEVPDKLMSLAEDPYVIEEEDLEEEEGIEELNSKTTEQPNNEVIEQLSSSPTEQQKFIERDPVDWESLVFKKILPVFGVVSLVLGIGFFINWSIEKGYLDETVRILLGILFSLGLVLLGEFLREKYEDFYPLITGAGIGGLLLVTFLARSMYDLMGPMTSMVLYLLEVLLGVGLALRYDSKGLALFSFLGALVAPFLTLSDVQYPIGMMLYVLALTGGGFWLSLYKKWGSVLGLLFAGAMGYELFLISNGSIDAVPGAFLVLLFGTHLLIGSGGIVRAIREKLKVPYPLKENQNRELFEVVLFCGSLLTANVFGYVVFELQEWSYFGYWLLLQAVGLAALSIWFSRLGLEIYQKIVLIAASGFLLLGTFIEVDQVDSMFLMAMLFILEGSLLSYVGKVKQESIFTVFGRIALWGAFFWIWGIESVWQTAVAIGSLMGGYLVSNREYKTESGALWSGAAILAMTMHLFQFVLGDLVPLWSGGYEWIGYGLLFGWGVGLWMLARKTEAMLFHFFGSVVNLMVGGLVLFMSGIGGLFWGPDLMKDFPVAIGLMVLMIGVVGIAMWYLRSSFLQKTSITSRMEMAVGWGIFLVFQLFFAMWHIDVEAYGILWMLGWSVGLMLAGNYFGWTWLSNVLGVIALVLVGLVGFEIIEDFEGPSVLLALVYVAFVSWFFWSTRPKEKKESSSLLHLWATHGGILFVSFWMFQVLDQWLDHDPLSLILFGVYGLVLGWAGLTKLGRGDFRLWGWGITLCSMLWYWGVELDGNMEMLPSITAFVSIFALVVGSTLMFFWEGLLPDKDFKKVVLLTALGLGTVSAFVFGVDVLEDPVRTLFWMLYGIGFLLIGIGKEWHYFRGTGLIVLSLVIAKLYLHDLWEWEVWMRFVAFFVLGLGILYLSFYFQKNLIKKDKK